MSETPARLTASPEDESTPVTPAEVLMQLMAAKTLDEFLEVHIPEHISASVSPADELAVLSISKFPAAEHSSTTVLAQLLTARSLSEFLAVEIPPQVRKAAAPAGLSLFEKIHQRYIPEELPFRHEKVMVATANMQAAQGPFFGAHVLVIPATREQLQDGHPYTADHIPAAQEQYLNIANRATGYWLEAAYPDAEYVAEARAGKGVPHAHIHRAPGNKQFFAALGSDDPEALVRLTEDRWKEVKHRVSFPPEYANRLRSILDESENLTFAELDQRYIELEQLAQKLATEMGFRPASAETPVDA